MTPVPTMNNRDSEGKPKTISLQKFINLVWYLNMNAIFFFFFVKMTRENNIIIILALLIVIQFVSPVL